jgi:hypothetical protein
MRYVHQIPQLLSHPPFTIAGEDGIQIAFEQLAGVGEVLFGVGDRRADPLKRSIENGDNALLFGKRWECGLNFVNVVPVQAGLDAFGKLRELKPFQEMKSSYWTRLNKVLS